MKTVIRMIIALIPALLLSLLLHYGMTNDGLITKFFGIGVLGIQSGSMEKTLLVGDVVVIKECEEYEVGDIVTFHVNGEYLVTHRIIKREGNNFVTKGDRNNANDSEKITKEQVEGKVICNSKLLKWVYHYWMIVVLVIFCILILL